MHVSPFNPSTGQIYEFKTNIKENNKNLIINVYNGEKINELNKNELIMTVNMNLNSKKFTYYRIPRNHLTIVRIYYQVFLWLKKYRYFKYLK